MNGHMLGTDAKIRVRNALPEGFAVEVEYDRLWVASIDRWAAIKINSVGAFNIEDVASLIATAKGWNNG